MDERKQLAQLKEIIDLQNEKIQQIRIKRITETDPSLIFKFENELKKEKAYRKQLEQEREALEKQLTQTPFDTPQAASSPSLFAVPFPPNRFFSGREAELHTLHATLHQQQNATIGQTHAISGLGGIGKTQLAIEYAYRYRQEYTYIFWALADTPETLKASYTEIAYSLNLREKDAQEQAIIIEAVKTWLSQHKDYLLILDNADDPSVLPPFLPSTPGGHLLITARAADLSTHLTGLTHPLAVTTFSPEQGALFLLHRANLLPTTAPLDQAHAATRDLALAIAQELGCLPLALDQAGAYINVTKSSLANYQQIYEKHRTHLLKERRGSTHPDPVATTWNLSFQRVEASNPAAADLLCLCAFLAPDAIPERILTRGAKELGPILAPVAADPRLLNAAIEALRAYSLIERDPETQTSSVHRLVQEVLRDQMSKEDKQQWAERVVRAVREALPPVESTKQTDWSQWGRILPHAQCCIQFIKDYNMRFTAATALLRETGLYLVKHAKYTEAEEWYLDCLSILAENQPPDSLLPKAIVLIDLGNVYSETGKYEHAEARYKESQDIFTRNGELDRREFARLLNNFAILLKVRGKAKEAKKQYIDSLNMQIQSVVTSGEVSGKPGEAVHLYDKDIAKDIATLSKVLGKLKEEINRHIRCLLSEKIAARTFAKVLNNLAVLYAEQLRKYDKTSERLFHLSMWLQEQHLEQYDSYYALTKNNLGNLYTVWGSNLEEQPEKRQTLYQEANSSYQICESIFQMWYHGVEHPDIAYPLHGQGILHFLQDRLTEAETCYQQCLQIWGNLQHYHPQIGYASYNLANCYVHFRHTEAEKYYQKCLDNWTPLGPYHPHTGLCEKNISAIQSRNPKGKIDELKVELVVLPTYRSFRL